MTWRPHTTVTESETFLAQCLLDWEVGHRQAYILTLGDKPEKHIGILDVRVHAHMLNIGYVFARRHWGLGLMPEAIRGLTEAAFALEPPVACT